ncbi:hypothetical protein SAY86_008180 [Trapa natans]|uniref:AB hydrolase-1 domain-containing protein n=1 Tax=Trapa natans TaxID=22666 RepID=A0AAN7KET3_TRANT|nr:hypothetical protein SAY86_008180 [Trapa natans]
MASQSKPLATSMNARIMGSGSTTMVLAHGLGTDQSLWDDLVPFLISSNQYRVLVFDWAFSGAVEDPTLYNPVMHSSYEGFASDLVMVLEEMAVTSVIYVGHSMSGMIGCLASIKRPELFQSLFLIGASPRYTNTDGYEGGFEASDIELTISAMVSDYAAWVSSFAASIIDPNHPAVVDKVRNSYLRMRPDIAVPLVDAVFHSDYRHILKEVAVPCHIVQTRNDRAAPTSVALYMKKRIGNSTLEMMEVDGHFPQLTAPEQLAQLLHRLSGPAASDTAVGSGGGGGS